MIASSNNMMSRFFGSKRPTAVSRWPLFAIFLLLPALILLFFARMAFSNLILARGDTFLYFYPYWAAAADALRNGRLPLWNPDLFMGAPLLANSQVGFFYPLNWPLWLLLDPPYAVKASILLHLFIGGWGAYMAGRRALALDTTAAMVTAVLFTLGGYVTAQVEHVNQLQGLAWLPWLLAALATYTRAPDGRSYRKLAQATAVFALLFALQLLAGHTQTTFISGVALLLWWVGDALSMRTPGGFGKPVRSVVALALGVGLALLLTAVQLLPTLELTQLSSREGGLTVNEVLSFSLHPLLLARTLLPGYGQALFSEYTAFLPLTALLLAWLGAWQWRQRQGALPALLLALAGLLLALGLFNPLHWLLAQLPGFNLFRVPARWLLLYAPGISLLAGLGWQLALERWRQQGEGARRPLRFGLFLLLGLLLWAIASNILATRFPTGPEAPYEAPTRLTLALWLAELSFAYLWLRGRRAPWLLLGVGTTVLFAASRAQPYNNLTTPEAYFDLRPPVARLLAASADGPSPDGPSPDGRFLSLSNTFFDPGDQAEIDSIYADQLDAAARYDYTVTLKQKEIIAPNLSLAYGLAAVDGFDGGILPLRLYSQMMTLLLPDGVETRDGRLREYLSAVPAARWLDLFNTRFLITDKTGDEWRAAGPGRDFSLFFDRQHPLTLAAGERLPVGFVPKLAATAVYVISSGAPGDLIATTQNGAAWSLPPQRVDVDLLRYAFPTAEDTPIALAALALQADTAVWQVQAMTLVNEQDGVFLSLVPGQYRLIHSGDVKIYENLDALPRAFLVADWQWQPDMAAALAVMRQPEFEPATTAIIVGSPTQDALPMPTREPFRGKATILAYAPEAVTVATQSDVPALLLLTDAFYPGWETAVDGTPAPLLQVDGLFRGVFVAAGRHEVTFTYRPVSLRVGWWLTGLGTAVWLALFALATSVYPADYWGAGLQPTRLSPNFDRQPG